MWILGDIFMAGIYTIFDYEAMQIGMGIINSEDIN